tara:strand:+ start:9553 stop:12600 length:3048 start_codon:yes stop_codon:yes gene_type:complete
MADRHADLSPSLGLPSESGPCYVVQRIEDEVRSPRVRDELEQKVEKGRDLTNPEARTVYDTITERGPGGMISKMEITGHAQYRMDLRGISVIDIRLGLQAFLKSLNDWKSQQSYEYDNVAYAIRRGEPIEYLFKKWNLFIAFTMVSKGTARIITIYWKGMKDPKAPGTCVVPHIHNHKQGDHSNPVQDWGNQTYTKTPTDSPDNRERQQVLPSPPAAQTKDLGPQTLNGPGESGSRPDGRSVHKDLARTQGVPGGDHPAPPARTSPVRRPEVTGDDWDEMEDDWDEMAAGWFDRIDLGDAEPLLEGSMKGKPYPGANRQREQRGPAKKYYRLRYKKKRQQYKIRMKRWYRRYKRNPRYLKDQDRRDRVPQRFKRKPGGGYRRNEDRARDYRRDNKSERKKKAAIQLPGVLVGPNEMTEVLFLGIDWVNEAPWVTLQERENTGQLHAPFEAVEEDLYIDDERLDEYFAYLDEVFEYEDEADMDTTSIDEAIEGIRRIAYAFKLKYRPVKKQRKQKGQKKWKAKMQHMRNRAKSKRRSRIRYKRLKRLPAFKKQQKIRRKHPERFKRRMGEVLTAPEIAFVVGDNMDLGYVRNISPMTGLVTFYRATERGAEVLWDTMESLPNEDFMASVAFLSEFDEEAMFKLLDVELGLEAWSGELSEDGLRGSAELMGIDCDSPKFQDLCEKLTGKTQIPDMDPAEVSLVDNVIIHQLVYDDSAMSMSEFPDRDIAEEPSPADPYLIDPEDDDWVHGKVYLPAEYRGLVDKIGCLWVARQAEMLYEKHPPKMDPEQVYDRAQDRKKRKKKHRPNERLDQPFVEENPGSAKVIPWDHPDFVNNRAAFAARTATRIHEIVDRCSEDLMARSRGLKPSLKRVDQKNAVWLFDVPGSKHAYRVRVKARRKGNVRDAGKVDIKVSCSCPFWQWQGPEHHAKVGDYLYGRPAGTASKPTTKDPDGRHAACKHVLAVFNHMLTNKWSVPRSKVGATRYLVDSLRPVEAAPFSASEVRAFSARYLGLKAGGD